MVDRVKVHRSHISNKRAKARGWSRPIKVKGRRKNAKQNSQTGQRSSQRNSEKG